VAAHGGEAGAFAAMGAMIPLGRFATPEEIAADVLHLLGPGATTETTLVKSGGFSLEQALVQRVISPCIGTKLFPARLLHQRVLRRARSTISLCLSSSSNNPWR